MSSSGGTPSGIAPGDLSGPTSAGLVEAIIAGQAGIGVYNRLQVASQKSDGSSYGDVLIVANGIFNGLNWDRFRTPAVFKTISTVAVGAETTIWTPAAGKKFRLMGFALALSAATTLTIKDNTAGATIFRLLLGVGGPGQTVSLGNGILSAAANNVLTATSGAAANLDGTVWGTEE